MSKTRAEIGLPEEKFRLEMKKLANEIRNNFNIRGITDVFDMVEDKAMLIRLPLEVNEISGFSTYYKGEFVVVLNTSNTYGHERFTAAHELFHIVFNQDILKHEKVLFREEKYSEIDRKANVFASELLMPEDYVKDLFYKLVNVDSMKVEVKHVVRLSNYVKVSYKAMVKKLIELNLCDISRYEDLVDYGTLANATKLQDITKFEGFNIELIVPSNVYYVSKEYIELVRGNYESGKISYGKLEHLLGFINKTPEDYGYLKE